MGDGVRTHAPPSLTKREAEVLERLGLAMSNKQIGDDLYLSVNSVKTHVRNLYKKLGVANRTEAVLWLHSHTGPATGDHEPTVDEIMGMAKGILMVEGRVDGSAAASVLAEAASQAGRDVVVVAQDLVAAFDTSRRPVIVTEARRSLLALCSRHRPPAATTR